MKLTVITINRNNSAGLEKTMQSVVGQDYTAFEYVIIDGASTDNSVDVIRQFETKFGERMRWISEPDKGIYQAMNKGIQMATGEYVQFLNSGDCLSESNVVAKMHEPLKQSCYPSILYGNMLKQMNDGSLLRDKCFAGDEVTLLGFYQGTLNHSPAYIRKELFSKYGMYDENLRIVSDWKWYLQAIILGEERPVYTNVDVTIFDMTGISETNKELDRAERRQVLSDLIPPTILMDYDRWTTSIDQMRRIRRHPWAYKVVWFIERCLFKSEKRLIHKKKERQYQ